MLKSTYLPAGVFNEPLSDLMKVLASLVDADNHILVKGFLDRVWLSSRPPCFIGKLLIIPFMPQSAHLLLSMLWMPSK